MGHCLACGCSHETEYCPPEAFRIVRCSCGNETLMPCDALSFGMRGNYCGQCNKDTEWRPSVPTIEDMKRHWPDYGTPKK